MGFNLDEDNPIPTSQDSETMVAQDAPLAMAYLRRTGNAQPEVLGALGLTAYA